MAQHVQSVLRAFDVLRTLAADDAAVSLADVAERAGLPASTTSRLLTTLESIAVVSRGPSRGTWMPGPGLAALTGPAHSVSHLLGIAHPYLQELVDRFGEDAALAVEDGFDLIYADQAHSPSAVGVPDWTGRRFAPHTVAGGFVIMACWPERKLVDYLARGPAPSTDRTLTNPHAIRARLAEVRRRGYGWASGEWVDGVSAVAAPVLTADGHLLATLNVFGPSFRFPDQRSRDGIGQELREVCARLGRAMAGRARDDGTRRP
ncbi:MAG TPA: IclR family transcriptional regulator [Euzebyales bacterium]|nr:IclR family transcriptional regulator [Euzebyales bacterium]